METTFASEVLLPAAIFLIMVAMGMTLTTDDFRRVVALPRLVAVGLVCQLVLLPLLGFGIASTFGLEAVFAVGIVLLAASPGGTTSNLVIHVADADRALSVTLTAISNSVIFLTMPFLLRLGYDTYGGDAGSVSLGVADTMLPVAAITIVPVLIGMAVRRRSPGFADRMERPGKIAAAAVLGIVILALVAQNLDLLISEGPRFAPAFIALNLAALAVGWVVAKLARAAPRDAFTIAVETGMQNSTLSITVALTLLDDSQLAIIPALYGLWMLVTGFGLAVWFQRTHAVDAEASAVA